MEDKEIIERYLSGQGDILNILIDRYKGPLYKLCYHLTSNSADADDLFQESWYKAMRNIRNYDCEKPFIPWLYTICTNLYKDRYRAKKRWLSRIKEYFSNEEKDAEMESFSDMSLLPDDVLEEAYTRESVKKCLCILDDIYRLPIILYYFKEIEYADIAAILGIPVGTVKSRLYAGKQKLKKLMEVEQFEG